MKLRFRIPQRDAEAFPTPEKAPRSVRTVNKRALVLAGAVLALALGALTYQADTRGSTAKATEGTALDSVKLIASRPPSDLEEKARQVQEVARPTGRGSAASLKEGDLTRQMRQVEEKRLLAREERATAAETSDMNVDLSALGDATRSGASGAAVPVDGESVTGGGGGPLLGSGHPIGGDLAAAGAADPNLQGRKEAFAAKEMASGYLPTRKQAQRSPYEIKQGTVIPGVMISGINSDLPGQIIAQVSQNVYDTATGRYLLIPQGTRLVGSYDSFVAIGQERAMVAWRRLQFPDGASLDILNMPGADEGGYAGFNDQVNNHYMKIFGSALMLSLVGTGYQLSQQHVGDPLSAQSVLAAQVGQQLAEVSGELMRRNMQIQPTIEIRPGYRFNVMVNKDMTLEPYVEGNP